MLRHFCKKNILDVLSSGSRVSSIRQTSSNLYEPVYLDVSICCECLIIV